MSIDGVDDEVYDEAVRRMKVIFMGWIGNLARDAVAQNSTIPVEVIRDALEQLLEEYKEVESILDWDGWLAFLSNED